MLTVSSKYISGAKIEFENFCDAFFKTDSEVIKYYESKNIPMSEDGDD